MEPQISKVISTIERQYVNWLGSTDQTRRLACAIDGVNLSIVLNQGHWTYERSCRVPEQVKDTLNVSSEDPRIVSIFKESLRGLDYKDYYEFRDNNIGTFKLRFFKDADALERKITAENRRFEKYQYPHDELLYNCTIL